MMLVLAQVPAASPSLPVDASLVATVWDMTVRGGLIMIPLAVCSLAAMTIVVERLILTRRARIVPPALLESLMSMKQDPRRALERCATDTSPLAAVIVAAIRSRHLPREQQERAVGEAGEREVRKVRQRMRLLSSLPQVATMLGLLGTVVGMIRTFTVVSASADALGKTERLAQGIHEAWTATAGGLIVAIPTLLAYHIIMGRIDAAAAAIDHAANLWLGAGDEQAAPAPARTVAESQPRAAAAPTSGETVANGDLIAAAGA
ncbi:MAG: MotA/TolQ/ExbB proton channel family protein [Phycisphaerae bacterium]|nr:MotA/TolQ/ExbB proton channel family protein [Phycisphaerae bacterium]